MGETGKNPEDYLGDGVYVEFDGFGYWLKANDHRDPTDRVYLEPEVLEKFKAFIEMIDKRIAEVKEAREDGKDDGG